MTEAEEVYLLMKEEYRISRNTRASWFFKHLNETIAVKESHDVLGSSEELEVLSILPIVEELTHDDEEPAPPKYELVPSTHISYLARRYRMVFILDFSPSMASVDIQLGKVNLMNSFIYLSNCLRGLIHPFCVPGSSLVLSPKIYITVIAYTPVAAMTTQQVLLQGYLLTAEVIDDLLQDLQRDIENFENKLFNHMNVITQNGNGEFSEAQDIAPSQLEMALPESCFMNMLWCGILALQLLPVNTSAGIVVITDGVIGVREDPILNNALAQLRDSTIACSFIQVGHGFLPHSPFGYIPHREIMQFIAAATMGSFLDQCPEVPEDSSHDMNIYHAALLVWSFQKNMNPLNGYQQSLNSSSLFEPLGSTQSVGLRMARSPNLPLQRVKHRHEALQTDLFNVMAVRLREGYCIKQVNVFKDKGVIEVRLALPCTHSGQIEYVAKAQWPPSSSRRVTHIEVVMEGTYEFIHDINCPLNRKETRSFFKTRVIKNFWQMIRSLRDTDKLLVHMQSFNANPAYYEVPEGTGKGMPLFYMPPSSDNPVLAQQHNRKDESLYMFAEFWKRIALMEPKLWQRWLHTHRIAMLLMPDLPLPKHLHHPNSSGRFGNVQCKLAQKELNALLRNWATFILLENHSYINITYEDKNGPPTSFFIIRVVCKGLTVVLRLAFLGGTPASVRYKLVNELKEKLGGLSMSQKLIHSKDPTRITKGRKVSLKGEDPKPTFKKPCVLLLQRPVEVILVKYEKMPSDFSDLKLSSEVTVPSVPVYMNRGPDKKLNRLACYLHHRRWIWDAQGDQPLQISSQTVLSILTRFKLQQGFHIAYSQSGIISFITELQLKSPLQIHSNAMDQPSECPESDQPTRTDMPTETDQPNNITSDKLGEASAVSSGKVFSTSSKEGEVFRCLVQYNIFPPHVQTLSKMQDTDVDPFEDIDMTEADGKLQLITECWVEPQCGTIFNSPPGRAFLDGQQYFNVPDLLFPSDDEIVRTLLTYEHLKSMCNSNGGESISVSSPLSPSNMATSESITTLPFSLDIFHLIPKCRQLELTCSTFLEGPVPLHREGLRYPRPNQTLFNLLLDSLSSEPTTNFELQLTPSQSLQFSELVLSRASGEDKKPFQITIEEIREIMNDMNKINARKASRARSGSELGESSRGLRRDRADTLDEDDVKSRIPLWTCFVQTSGTETLFLVIVPADHGDLLKLQGKAYVPLVEVESDSSALSVKVPGKNSSKEGDTKRKDSKDESKTKHKKSEQVPKGKRKKHKKAKKISSEEQKTSYNLPIFVYECSLSSLTNRLLKKDPDRVPKDISKDISFSSFDRESIPGTPRSFRRISHLIPTDSDDLSESSKRAATATPVDPDKPRMSREMEWFFALLSNKVHKSFVVAVFKSLQQGQNVDQRDVSAAIENICSESLYEIDITSYMQAVCGHVREATEVVEDGMFTDRYSRKLNFAKETDDNEDGDSSRGEREGVKDDKDSPKKTPIVPSNESPKREVSYRIPVSAFLARQTCEVQTGLHALIKNKFTEIMGRSFKQIPSNENLWFYSMGDEDESPLYSSQSQITTQDEVETSGTELVGEQQMTGHTTLSENSQVENTSESSSREDDRKINSIVDNYTIIKTAFEHINEDRRDSILSQYGSDEEDISPLFVTLVCSINLRGNVGNMPVQTIPSCLGVLVDCLERSEEEINLDDLRLTLDLICLTLPADIDRCTPYDDDDSEHSERRRGTSFTENSPPDSPPAVHGRPNGRGGVKLFSVSEFDDLPSGCVDDTLESLSEHQKNAIQATQEDIKWLLKDEIASARRHIFPVTVSTLDMVANHVCTSLGKETCLYKQVDLKFVFGPEQSLSEFIKTFEEIKVAGYNLNKIHEHYYLSLDPVSPPKDLDGSWRSDQFDGKLPFSSKSTVSINVTETTGEGATRITFTPPSPQRLAKDHGGKDFQGEALEEYQDSKESVEGNIRNESAMEGEEEELPGVELQAQGDDFQEKGVDLDKTVHAEAMDQDGEAPVAEKGHWVTTQSEKASGVVEIVKGDNGIGRFEEQGQHALGGREAETGLSGDDEEKSNVEKNVGLVARMEEALNVAEKSAEGGVTTEDKGTVSREGQETIIPADMHITHSESLRQSDLPLVRDSPIPRDLSDSDSSIQVISELSVGDDADDEDIELKEGQRSSGTTSSGQGLSGPKFLIGSLEENEDSQRTLTRGGGIQVLQQRRPERKKGVSYPSWSTGSGTVSSESSLVFSHRSDSQKSFGFPIEQLTQGAPVETVHSGEKVKSSVVVEAKQFKSQDFFNEIGALYGNQEKSPQSAGEATPGSDQQLKGATGGAEKDGSSLPEGVSMEGAVVAVHHDFKEEGRDTVTEIDRDASLTSTPAKTRNSSGTEGGRQGRLRDTPRSRHSSSTGGTATSGPLSTQVSCNSLSGSQTECDEEGYEGGPSDDEFGDSHVFSENDFNAKHKMPDFWLILKIHEDKEELENENYKMNMYFHTRDKGEDARLEAQKGIFDEVAKAIKETCRLVSQRLLLIDLYDSKVCNPLLIPDEHWNKDDYDSRTHRYSTDNSVDLSVQVERDYLAARLDFDPGHFACEEQWRAQFIVHPRLPMARKGSSKISGGMQAVKAAMEAFAINNRPDLYVVKDDSHEVFYMRLSEPPVLLHPSSSRTSLGSEGVWTEPTSLQASRTTSIQNLAAEEDSSTSLADSGRDTLPESLRNLANQSRSILLTVYGLTKPGPEIHRDLQSLLQKRLDQVTLEVIKDMLDKNAMSRLTARDVQFIQPQDKAPSRTVHFTIPMWSARYIYAVGFYLQQNLLEFLYIPKYTDSKPQNHFQDYTLQDQTKGSPFLLDIDTFLYNRPHRAGGTGIACIIASIVDGKSNQISHQSCPRPSPDGYQEILPSGSFLQGTFEEEQKQMVPVDFSQLTSTKLYQPSRIGAKGPGPVFLVQFNIWERGNADIPNLITRLEGAIHHALCDVIMEYRILTAPLASLPPEVLVSLGRDSISALQSPTQALRAELFRKLGPSSNPAIIQTAPVKTTCEMPSSQTSYSPITPPDMPRSAEPSQHSATHPVKIRKRSTGSTPKSSSISSMESGGKSGSKRQLVFDKKDTGISVDCSPLASNPSTPTKPRSSDISPRVNSRDEPPVWQTREQERRHHEELNRQLREAENGETGRLHAIYSTVARKWLDFEQESKVASVHKTTEHIQSRFSVDLILLALITRLPQVCSDTTFKLFCKTGEGYQLYQPASRKKNRFASSQGQHRTIPRPGTKESFVLIGRNIHQWRYSLDCNLTEEDTKAPNLINPQSRKSFQQFTPCDLSAQSGDTLERLQALQGNSQSLHLVPRQRLLLLYIEDKELTLYTYNWSTELVHSLEAFFHRLIMWHNSRSHLVDCLVMQKMGLYHHKQFGDIEKDNPFCKYMSEIGSLIQQILPPNQGTHSGPSTSLPRQQRRRHKVLPPFDETMAVGRIPRPLHKSPFNAWKDPVLRHGAQLQEVCNQARKDFDSLLKIQDLYVIWQQKKGSSQPISYETLAMLKQQSRLLTHCSTPILFSPEWRKIALLDLNSSEPVHQSSQSSVPEEAWHNGLRLSFLQQYIKYLELRRFHSIEITYSSPKRSFTMPGRTGKEGSRSEGHVRRVNTSYVKYMQITVLGGIILAELSFQHVFFSVKLYAFESSRLPRELNINSRLGMLFTDECDSFKDLIHLNSFSFDFHLRTIQEYLSSPEMGFKMQYHVTSFLADFIKFFTPVPRFCKNVIQTETQGFLSHNTPAPDLYDYLTKHRHYDFFHLNMIKPGTSDEHEKALVNFNGRLSIDFKEPHGDGRLLNDVINVSFIISWDEKEYESSTRPGTPTPGYICEGGMVTDAEKNKNLMRLKYYLIVDSTMYPYPTGAMGVPLNKPPLMHDNDMLEWNPRFSVMKDEMEKKKQLVYQLVTSAAKFCRRDTLWAKLLQSEGDGAAPGKKNKKKDEGLIEPAISFAEFKVLLETTINVSLTSTDKRLEALLNNNTQWYTTLLQSLRSKFNVMARYFQCEDGMIHQLAVLNQSYPSMIVLLTVDLQAIAVELEAVYRDQKDWDDASQISHTQQDPGCQKHIETVINAICFHLWTTIL